MPNKFSNDESNLYIQDDENGRHTPEMETIEKRLIAFASEENQEEDIPYTEVLFLAKDIETSSLGDEA